MAASVSERDWQVRLHIYRFFIEQARPPSVAETASAFGTTEDDVEHAYRRLDHEHIILLDPGTSNVRIANPLSAVETPHRVTINGRALFANCAFDMLGVPAMLRADATIRSAFTNAESADTPAHFEIVDGTVRGNDGIIHFAIPFRHWYDNQIHT